MEEENLQTLTKDENTHHKEGEGGIFSFEPGLAIWTWVVFALVFFILSKYAWRPMMEAVRKREQLLKDAIDDAKKTKEELQKISARQEEMIKTAEQNARKIVEESRANAEATSKEIVERAQKEAEEKFKQAKEQIVREQSEALKEIKKEVAEMVVTLSEKILSQKLNSEDKQKEFIAKELDKL